MKPRSHHTGFTLIELLVSLTIFTVVVTMSTGTLLILIDSNAKAQNLQAVITNLNFALDSMTREIRTGSSYDCDVHNSGGQPSTVASLTETSDCNNGNFLQVIESGNSLTGTGNPRIGYFYDADFYGNGQGALLRRIGTGAWFPITAENVRITTMEFEVTGTSVSEPGQPTVTIYLEGEAGDIAGLDTAFSMQTTVTQRLLDL